MTETNGGSAPPRPRQVLVSGVVAAAACGLLVVTLFDALTRMRSTETRQSVADSLAKHNDLGLSVADVLGVMRGVTFVSGALAAAGVVLAVYALQRHRGARLGLTVVAVVLVFTATLVAGLLPLLVGVAVLRLWSRDARDWFDGRPARVREPVGSPRPPDAFSAGPPSGEAPAQSWPTSAPPPDVPTVEPGGDPWVRPAASPYAFGTPPPRGVPAHPLTQAAPRPARTERPGGVVLACWLTWVLCGLVAAFLLLLAVLLTADTAALVAELQRNPRIADAGLTDRQVIGTLWLTTAIGITWSLSAIALAVLAYRRVDAGRIGLVASAILSAVVGLVAAPVGWLNAAGAITATVLLLRRPAQEWYAGRDRDAGGPPPPTDGPATRQHPQRQPEQGPPQQAQDQPPGNPPVW
jgi:hypothetical protein